MIGRARRASSVAAMSLRYYDIGLNLTDAMFRGIYNGKQYHEADVGQVLGRAHARKVSRAMLTGSSLAESLEAIGLCEEYFNQAVGLGYTIGVHPCCVNEFADQDARIDNPSNDETLNGVLHLQLDRAHENLARLHALMEERLATDAAGFKAVGEIGLDYDRFHYSSREMQLIFFEEQLKLSCLISNARLPLFLHMRSCCDDFVAILRKFVEGFHDHEDRFNLAGIAKRQKPLYYRFESERKFVTHSFTGSGADLQQLLSLSPNSYVGINGCSLKTEENLECAAAIPVDRLLLETDAPWCDIRRTHASYGLLGDYESAYRSVKRDKLSKTPKEDWDKTMVKTRNEPCNIEQVAIVMSKLKDMDLEQLVQQVWQNSIDVYG